MHLFTTICCLHSDTKLILRHAQLLHNWLIYADISVYLPVLEMQYFTNTHVWNAGRLAQMHLTFKKYFFGYLNNFPLCSNIIVRVKSDYKRKFFDGLAIFDWKMTVWSPLPPGLLNIEVRFSITLTKPSYDTWVIRGRFAHQYIYLEVNISLNFVSFWPRLFHL